MYHFINEATRIYCYSNVELLYMCGHVLGWNISRLGPNSCILCCWWII